MDRFIQMFSGIDGFRLGLERSSWKCVWSNDNDKYACKISRKNYPNGVLVEADIKTIDTNSIPDHTLLTAGFPCQAFSVAGKRKGFKDTRGTLFHEICRIAKAKKPPLLLLENVKGLLSHDEGLTFQIILESLSELGYLVEWQVLNSKHFGVPQNRERVFIIGHLRGKGSKQIFPIGENGKTINQDRTVVRTLQGGGHSGGLHSQTTMIQVGINPERQGNRVYAPRGLSPTLPTACGGRHIPQIIKVLEGEKYARKPKDGKIQGGPSSSITKRVYGTEGCSSGLMTQERVVPKVLTDRVRRLTPTECERLQGFLDGWTKGVSDTQRYKLLGNAVTVNVIQFLGKRLLWSLK